MRQVLPIVLVSLAFFSLVGFCTWAWFPSNWRRLLLPAVPLVGAMTVELGLHLTSLLVGVRLGLPIVAGIALALLGARSVRHRWWRDLQSWPWLVAGVAVGAVYVAVMIAPLHHLGATLFGSFDSFAYVSNAAWFIDHPITAQPPLTPPWGYTHLVVMIGFRVGEELNQAAVAVLTGHDPRDSFYSVTAAWLLMLPGGLVAAASAVKLDRLTGLLAGAVATGGFLVLYQVVNSNSAGVLGIAMAPLALALVARYFDDAVLVDRARRLPAWAAAGAFAALASTYTEFVPLVVGGIAGYALIRRVKQLERVLPAVARLAGATLLIAPLGWFRAVDSLRYTTGIAQGGLPPSPFLGYSFSSVVSHYAGTRFLFDPQSSKLGVVITALIALGALVGVSVGPARRFLAWTMASVVGSILVLSTVHYFPYGQGRAVEITLPLVVLASASGYAELSHRLWAWGATRPLAVTVASGAVATGLAMVIAGNRTVEPLLSETASPQSPTFYNGAEYDAAHNWVAQHGGPEGSDAMVLGTQVFDTLWMEYRFRDLPRVNFPFLIRNYDSGRSPTRYFDGRLRPYAVVEVDLPMTSAPSSEVARDDRFLLSNTGAHDNVIALGAWGFNPVVVKGSVTSQQLYATAGDVLLFYTPGTHAIELQFSSPAACTITVAGGVVPAQNVTLAPSSVASVPVTLPPGSAVDLQVTVLGSGACTQPATLPSFNGVSGG